MQKPKLAALCDDASLRLIEPALRTRFDVLQARDARKLLSLAEDQAVTVVIADHALATGGAIELLLSVRSMRPDVRRVLLVDHCDLAIIVKGIHSGIVERIIYKPIAAFEVVAAVCPPEATPAKATSAAQPAVSGR